MPAGNGSIGRAIVGAGIRSNDTSQITTSGDCVEETLMNLERGGRSNPLPRPVLESIRTQATDILGKIVDSYSQEVAGGEVGLNGSTRASTARPLATDCPTGLLYGRVQSGKTVAMIVTSAMAIDNGFRVIIVLTSNNLKLVEQTADRFQDIDGPLIHSSLQPAPGEYTWEQNRQNIRYWLPSRGAVFVCAKEDGHLRALIRFLQSIGAGDYPALILDDEADHATPDTRTAARTRGRFVPFASTTFRLVVYNDDPQEMGLSLRESLSHNVFLQVTATPYGLLLQNLDNPIKPSFTHILPPGRGYTGGETFFAHADDTPTPPLVYVDEAERLTAQGGQGVPPGLARSLALFLLSTSAHLHLTSSAPRSGYKYLCHTSASQAVHQQLADLIRQYLDGLATSLDQSFDQAITRPELTWAHAELERTVPALPGMDILARIVLRHLPRRDVRVVNAESEETLDFHSRFNFIVGGNILGRGLTIDDLFVTYYLRQARVTQMDTMHQHARMYGYRESIMPFTRVFLPQSLALRFRQIHESEDGLRQLLITDDDTALRATPVQVAGNLRPTRPGILDVGAISAYRAGQQVYPVEPVHDPAALGDSVQALHRMIAQICGGTMRTHVYVETTLEVLKNLLETVKVQADDGDWNTAALLHVFDAIGRRYQGRGYLFVREFERASTTLSSGAVSGDEQRAARTKAGPVLFMFLGRRGRPWNADIVYPTVVFPSDMPAMVFNRND